MSKKNLTMESLESDVIHCILISPGKVLDSLVFDVDKKTLQCSNSTLDICPVRTMDEQIRASASLLKNCQPSAVILESNLLYESSVLEYGLKRMRVLPASVFRMRYTRDMGPGLASNDNTGHLKAMATYWASHILPKEGSKLLEK